MLLFRQFDQFIRNKGLFDPSDRILIAVSGGIDSMTLLHLMAHAGIPGAVAHCNFSLRGSESDEDERFVERQAKQLGYFFHTIRFDTSQYALDHHCSIQMAARDLRYEWFERLRKDHGYTLIALAHNLNDRIETFFINLSRGTGIAGLGSINPRQGVLIRPLLFATRAMITDYARQQDIAFREDSSNQKDDYTRNYLRHHILPGFKDYFPSFEEIMAGNMDKFSEVALIYRHSVRENLERMTTMHGRVMHLNIQSLLRFPAPQAILYEWLKPCGFSNQIAASVLSVLETDSGKQFFSPTHRLVCDRGDLLLEELTSSEKKVYYIEESVKSLTDPVALKFAVFEKTESFHLEGDSRIAWLDYETLQFPLILRKWRNGDYFCPLGMKSLKKVSDFFINEKMSIIDKEKVWILYSGDEIVWIVGRRIDHRYRVTPSTRKVLKVELDTLPESEG
ncbi:MAG: tRNA lysidine(34) synthetase TilS [Bacteroidales bacterium]|nr:tRNA lysidine(34) synthetase TilS [Bacteroidales bacterium]